MPEQIISASGAQYGMTVNPDGSINAIVLGSIFIGSVTTHVDSIYIQSGDNINIASLPGDLGSVVISSAPLLGVSGLKLDDLAGSVGVTALPGDLGSVVISSAPLIGVSGLIFTDGKMTGSMAMKGIGSVVISSSTKLGVSGIVEVNEVIPTDTTRQNPSYALVYDPADSISGIYFQTATGSYFQGFLWDAGSNIVYISEWGVI